MKHLHEIVIFGLLGSILLTSCKEQTTVSKESIIDYTALTIELENLYDKDQEYRVQFTEMIQNQEPFDNEFVNAMNAADSLNKTRVVEVLEEYGWIPKENIGDKAFNAMFLVIQHADVVTMEKYYPEFQQLANQDLSIGTSAALMQDRILMYNSKRQIYGSQSSGRTIEDGTYEYFIWPIADVTTVNERRTAVGFEETVEEYALDIGSTYDPEEPLVQFGN